MLPSLHHSRQKLPNIRRNGLGQIWHCETKQPAHFIVLFTRQRDQRASLAIPAVCNRVQFQLCCALSPPYGILPHSKIESRDRPFDAVTPEGERGIGAAK